LNIFRIIRVYELLLLDDERLPKPPKLADEERGLEMLLLLDEAEEREVTV
jgi:hypothetical protein